MPKKKTKVFYSENLNKKKRGGNAKNKIKSGLDKVSKFAAEHLGPVAKG